MENPTHNRRHFTRIPMDCAVTLACGAQQWQSQLHDISLKGALLAAPENFVECPPCSCRLMLALNATDTTIMMVGHIVHHEEGQLGFRCDNIDLDSITHLKRMVELNLGDEGLLERELGELLAVAP
ncbi:MAG: PilZ domain-containing protein [Gammaproteobacteria bacterium]|nr:PilZ domain-containing protein [Gammaproteobacteria bacterium]